MEIEQDVNIFVGTNDTGKSSVLLAVEMALNGRFRGRPVDADLSPHWFNHAAVEEYLAAVATNPAVEPPAITVEAFFLDAPELEILRGKNNSRGANECGVRLHIHLDPAYAADYAALVASGKITSIPVEYFRVDRHDFAGENLAGRRAPVRAVLIDASTLQLQSGMDYYLRRSIREHLSPEARAKLSLTFRQHRDEMLRDDAFTEANAALRSQAQTLSDRELSLATDVSGRASWESGITPHIGDTPFELTGQGEQSAFKVLLALSKSRDTHHVVMVEEPENHLSHANLNRLLTRVSEQLTPGQQLLVSTHSSFVLNKLGIEKLRLMTGSTPPVTAMRDLSEDTFDYFRKLPGFDTLRLLLADAVILVEGPSDELLVQRAYRDKHGRLPVQDGIDVMSVGLTFKRFLELARFTKTRKVAVITDLDDNESDEKARARFHDFEEPGRVQGFVGEPAAGRTLENQVVRAAGVATINGILGQHFAEVGELVEHMKKGKTEIALALFDSDVTFTLPKHFYDAVNFVK